MPMPTGTGFFISENGWFVTAAHVVQESGQPGAPVRNDVKQSWLKKELRFEDKHPIMCEGVSVEHVELQTDFALLKVDPAANSTKAWLEGSQAFPFLQVSRRQLEEGEPVYSFGYPLSDGSTQQLEGMVIGTTELSPRVTSAIISSTIETSRMLVSSSDARVYVLDKALNYGNSGGPIVSAETGHVHALCSRFQPVSIPQAHLKDAQGNPIAIMTPGLYGVVSSLGNPSILAALTERGVPLVDD